MKLLSRGVNPASLADIDLDQYSSDDDSRYRKIKRFSSSFFFVVVNFSDDVGSDSSADDGLPKHLEAIAAEKVD